MVSIKKKWGEYCFISCLLYNTFWRIIVYDFLHCYCCGEKPIQESVQTPSQEKCTTAETVGHKHVSETMNLVAIARNYDMQMPFV